MAKIKYDVSDVESQPDFDTPIPKGVYKCKVTDITEGQSKASVERGNPEDMLTVEYEVIKKGDFKGRKLWDYIVLNDASAWKLKQLVEGLGKKAKGTLDTAAAIGAIVLVRVKHETDDRDPDNIEVRARVGSVAAVPEDVEEEEDDEDDDEVEDDEVDDDEGEEEEYTFDDIEEMSLKDLKDVIEEEELDDVRVTKRSKVETIREKVQDALGLEEDEDEEDEEEDVEVPESYEELEELDREDLESLIEQEDLEVKFRKNTKDEVLLERVAEALELEEDEEEDEDEDEEDYEDMSLKDLKTELKQRGLSEKGRKPALVERLEEDDADGDEPF